MKKIFAKISLLCIGLMLCMGTAWAAGTYHDPVGDGDGYYEETYGPVTYRIDYTLTNGGPSLKNRSIKSHNGTETAYITNFADQVVLTLIGEISFVSAEYNGEPMQEKSIAVAIEPGTFTDYTGFIFLPEWNKDNAQKNIYYKGTDNGLPVWDDVFGSGVTVYAWNNTNLLRYNGQYGEYTLSNIRYYYWDGHITSANIIDTHNVLYEGNFGTGNALHWALYDDGTLAITGSGAMPDLDYASDLACFAYRDDVLFISIGKDITKIGANSFGANSTNTESYTHLYSVSFEEGTAITEIGDKAFDRATNLYSIILPSTITTIGNQAFYGCTKLQSITLPASVNTLGNNVFQLCTNLRTVTVERTTPPTIGSSIFSSSSLQTIVIPENTICAYSSAWGYSLGGPYVYRYASDGDEAYCGERTCGENLNWSYNPAYHKLTISGTGTTMTDYASASDRPWHSQQNNIRYVEFDTPNLEHIGKYAFSAFQDSKFTTITIPATVKSIGDRVFNNCIYLGKDETITIPKSVRSIGEYAFYNCYRMNYLALEEGSVLESIGNSAFNSCKQLVSFTLPESVTSVGDGAFNTCNNLTTPVYNSRIFAKMPNNWLTEEHAPSGVYSIPNGIVTIAGTALMSCTNLHGIVIPNSVTTIGNDAISWCSNVTSVEIPETVTSLGNNVFLGCSKLESVNIPSTITSLGSSIFSSCSALASIDIPSSVTSIGDGAFQSCSKLTSITIPNSVTSLGNNVFSSCSKLEAITIPNSVTSIGNYAFQSCTTLVSVDIPNTVTSLGQGVFQYCKVLESVKLPAGLTEIPNRSFQNCYALSDLYLRSASIETIGATNTFVNCTTATTIHVPVGSLEYYTELFNGATSKPSPYEIVVDNTIRIFSDESAASTNSTLVSIVNDNLESVALARPVQKGGQYNTLCLPFSLNEEQIAKSSLATAEIFKFSGATKDDDELELYFQPVTEITAGVPYFFRYMDNGDILSMLSFADVTVETATAGSVTHNGVTLIGTLSQVSVSGSGKLYLAANNELHWSESAKTINPFRAYFSVAGLPAGARPRARIVEHENVATDIESVQPSVISSQKIIENGQLFILKNGVKYNVQGQIVK